MALALACLIFESSFAGSIRINGRVVETGLSKGKVQLLLGEPHWRADYLLGDIRGANFLGNPLGLFSDRTGIAGYSGNFELLGPVSVEESQDLMQLLRFEDQRLVSIKVGYGFDAHDRPNLRERDWSTVQPGDTSYEVVRLMGEPTTIEDLPCVDIVRTFGPYRSTLDFRSARVTWWYYNQGPNRLFRIVKLVNGCVWLPMDSANDAQNLVVANFDRGNVSIQAAPDCRIVAMLFAPKSRGQPAPTILSQMGLGDCLLKDR